MEENQESPKEQQQKSTSPFLIVGIIIVIVVIAGAFWVASNQSKKTGNNNTTTQTQTSVTVQPTASENTTEKTMTQAIAVQGGNFYFKPNEIKVKKGEKVTITFSSLGGMHNFMLDEFNVKSETVNNGSTTVEFTPDKTGTFEFYCGIGNHRQMGMKGKLIVE